MEKDKLKPVAHSVGKAFGNSEWFVFHCAKCNAQLDANTKQRKCNCGQIQDWEALK